MNADRFYAGVHYLFTEEQLCLNRPSRMPIPTRKNQTSL